MLKKSHSALRSFPTVEDVIADLNPGYPVYCLRLHELKRQAKYFLDNFPGRVLYAVKCNPHRAVLQAIYDAGIRHFDTASLVEIADVREHFPQADCYFMHPVKARAAIQASHQVYNVDHYVIDHENELQKLIEATGGGDGKVVLVRIVTPVHDSQYQLSDKFGISAEAAPKLLRQVHDANFQTGVAFHVGSQCRSPRAFRDGVNTALEVIEAANVPVHYLDVGGGFPAWYEDDRPPPLDEYFKTIYDAFENAKLRRDCVLMCEPGRAMVASGCSLLVQILLRKDNQLYINDGIYQSLSETLVGNMKFPTRLINPARQLSEKMQAFKILGPTCDSLDVLPEPFLLPENADEGDWIEIGQAGAYTNAAATRFNGFYPETFVSVDAPPLLPG
ncbi:MAG: type III PLP-dependent enzyme [Gammaproteobacteria bacterium]|nr:type III PLP-dependent enzyme [Gammaproteobacteria bacterium]